MKTSHPAARAAQALAAALLASACAPPGPPPVVADAIWHNGAVVTIDEAIPAAEAVASRGGKILAVGSAAEIMQYRGSATRMNDLNGGTLIPGFVDAHGHVTMVGFQAQSANLLPPPDGPNASIAELQKTLRDFRRQSPMPAHLKVLFGFGYDDSQLREKRHPTRQDLDAVATDMPVALVHQSGHFGALNSRALEMAGISAASNDPDGGVIRRRPGSREPDGVLEENAFFLALARLFPRLGEAEAIAMLAAGQKLYVSHGYTTLQDGRTAPAQVKATMAAAQKGVLQADVVSYPDILKPGAEALMQAPFFHPVTEPPQYTGHFRIGGVKLTLDGSPQGKTAWLSRPYFKVPAGNKPDYAGYGVVKDAGVFEVYDKALSHRWQVLTHANGDRAIDQMITAMRKAEQANPGVDVRPVLVHGQTLRKDQVPELKALGVFPSLFPMHTYYWGDWHRQSVLGPQRAENISPMKWVVDAGMRVSSHHDAPVALPDSMRVLSATVNRTTRSGFVLGAGQRLDPLTALKSMTIWAAYQHFEENTKGSITPGKLADFAVLSANPLSVPRDTLASIKVLQTFKEGNLIYDRALAQPPVASRPAEFAMHGNPELAPAAGLAYPAQGDGDLPAALEVILDQLWSEPAKGK
ncbi:amidohydrolase [Cupriavidus sp. 2TAF22]|uniref:amidohydrolase n=1 Tax=unclassified Cupriavidus TaxID=2640874 RepID=UPI003F8F7A9E